MPLRRRGFVPVIVSLCWIAIGVAASAVASRVLRPSLHQPQLPQPGRHIRNGPNWKDAAIIITYDEHGGFWDHVTPPIVDRWGPGARVPGVIISPYAKKAYIDHTQYETVSILSFIETRWKLTPLNTRDANAANLTAAFDFSQTP